MRVRPFVRLRGVYGVFAQDPRKVTQRQKVRAVFYVRNTATTRLFTLRAAPGQKNRGTKTGIFLQFLSPVCLSAPISALLRLV